MSDTRIICEGGCGFPRAFCCCEPTDAMQDDVLELLRALKLPDCARPASPHRVVQDEILPAVAALTAENAQLRETLTLGLGEQESVIAGLRAENERLREAVKGLPRFECTMGGCGDPECCGSYPEMEPDATGEWARYADIVAALPSSRETTDGRTDPS